MAYELLTPHSKHLLHMFAQRQRFVLRLHLSHHRNITSSWPSVYNPALPYIRRNTRPFNETVLGCTLTCRGTGLRGRTLPMETTHSLPHFVQSVESPTHTHLHS